MPHLAKKTLSQYIRTGCKRQLRLNLSPDTREYQTERAENNMPPKQPPRPGLEQFTQAGEEWQRQKLHDLVETFGETLIVGEVTRDSEGRCVFGRRTGLRDALSRCLPHQFIVEPVYTVGPGFQTAMGIERYASQFGLSYGELIPDLIQVLPPLSSSKAVTPSGHVVDLLEDGRLQLRVIDIKLTAEPSPSYFSEVAYYTCALSGWLIDEHLEDRFVVIRDCAVWPGSHDASMVTRRFRELQDAGIAATGADLLPALVADLEIAPFEVFALRLRRFLQVDVPEVLGQLWTALPWHVDNRCRGCDYLGHPWRNARGQRTDDPNHCIPMALREDHLSRVAFISRGAGIALQGEQVTAVAQLAALPPDSATFDVHQALRATRTVVAGRARALQSNSSTIPDEAGSSAVMPRWADLRIYITVDFDITSAITLAIGLKAFWRNPDPDLTGQHTHFGWRPSVFVIPQRRPEAEQTEVLAFLAQLNSIIEDARSRNSRTTFQLYLWDSLQYEHFARIIGRHLEAILRNGTISQLAWLFPPEEVMPNPQLSTCRSPITLVKDAVRALVAAPIPHYYGLLATAREYHDVGLPDNIATFSVHPLFEDPLSDQIPSERAHEIWTHSTRPHWAEQLEILRETVRKRLTALETVGRRLETDLRPVLSSTAPRLQVGPPERLNRASSDGQLWYAFSKLDDALQEVEVHRIRAMPPHEREAKFTSGRLENRLRGVEEQAALTALQLAAAPERRVYRLRTGSIDVKLKEHDFNVALVPESQPLILDHTLAHFIRGTALEDQVGNERWTRMENLLNVRISGLERDQRLVAVDLRRSDLATINALEREGLLDLDHDVILDPTHKDFFTPKLRACLIAIGNPVIAREQPNVRRALGQVGRGARRAATTPVAEAIWAASVLNQTAVQRDLTGIRDVLTQARLTLNDVQWRAWDSALSRRMQLLWGPPGTGKTRTLRNIALAALLSALRSGERLRVLVCASTYTALDEVLLKIYADREVLGNGNVTFYRLRSQYRPVETHVPPQIDLSVNRAHPSAELRAVRTALRERQAHVVIGAAPEQIHNIATLDQEDAVQPLFDLILIDEATQMDVAHSILPLCTMAPGCCVILAGDRLQLPPIHQAEPPLGLEDMLGPAYVFFRNVHGVREEMLEVNYRSADEIVAFCRSAGYGNQFSSWSPQLKLHLLSPLPQTAPPRWPQQLGYTRVLETMLDPELRCVCVVYDDGRSSQSNKFEADVVAGLASLLFERLSSQLLNERTETGEVIPPSEVPYDAIGFWRSALGVVTPHRAQQALVTGKLQELFTGTGVDPRLIRNAVDTVERFQGQQRDVIIASFSLGDPDQIAEEDEFLHSLNRFNVMASRARAKLIVLVSQQVVDHLAGDLEVLNESRLLKSFVDSFCNLGIPAQFEVTNNGVARTVDAFIRFRQ